MSVVPRSEREQLGTDLPEEEQEAARVAEAEAQQEQEAAAAAQAEQDHRPDWLPEKFKDPEAFVKSYGSLENELRARGERERELTSRLDQLEAYAQESQQQPRAQADDPRAAYAAEVQAAMDAGDGQRLAELQEWHTQWTLGQAMQGLQQQSQQQQQPIMETQNFLTAATVKRSVQERIPDFNEYEERVGQMLTEEPWRMPDEVLGDPAAMERALVATYEAVKFKDLVEQQRQLEEAGVTTADVQRARKLGAQTLTGASGRPGEPSEADKQIAEMRQALDQSSWDAHISRPSK